MTKRFPLSARAVAGAVAVSLLINIPGGPATYAAAFEMTRLKTASPAPGGKTAAAKTAARRQSRNDWASLEKPSLPSGSARRGALLKSHVPEPIPEPEDGTEEIVEDDPAALPESADALDAETQALAPARVSGQDLALAGVEAEAGLDKPARVALHLRALRDYFAPVDDRAELKPKQTVETSLAGPSAAAAIGLEVPASRPLGQTLLAKPQGAAPEEAAEETPAPAPQAPKPEKKSAWFGLGKVAFLFILAMVVAQIGVEALGAATPGLISKNFKDLTFMAELTIFASVAGIAGRVLAPMAIGRWGLKKTFLAATAGRLVVNTGLAVLLGLSQATWLTMMAAFVLNGFLGGVAITAETSIPPALMGQDRAKLEKFWGWQQVLLEIIGVAGPIATGAIVTKLGFLPPLIAFPAAFGLSIVMMFLWLKIPEKASAMAKADARSAPAAAQAPTPKGNVFKQFFGKIARGFKVVWKNPLLRTAFLAYTVYMMLNPFLYSMIAPNFGERLLGAGNEAAMTGVVGMLTGLYSLGGLLGGLLMIREQKKLDKAGPQDPKKQEETEEALRRSMLKWMLWGTIGLAALGTLALPIPMLGKLIALPAWLSWLGPLTVPALALIPFGAAQVVSALKIKSYFQSQVRDEDVTDAMGFFSAASMIAIVAGLLGLKFLFKGLGGMTPFLVIAGLMIPLALLYLALRKRLGRLSAPRP